MDLLQLHNTIRATTDPQSAGIGGDDLAAAADAIHAVVREGLAAHAGFTGVGETEPLHAIAGSGRFETMQSYFNAINPSAGHAGAGGGGQDMAGVIDVAASAGLGVIAIRVMAGGRDDGAGAARAAGQPRPRPGAGPRQRLRGRHSRAVWRETLARELGLESALELSFRLVIAHRGVSTALVGFSDIGQLEDAIRWAERGPLSADQVQRVVEAAKA